MIGSGWGCWGCIWVVVVDDVFVGTMFGGEVGRAALSRFIL